MVAVGLAILYASGIIYFVELALALIGVQWSVWNVTALAAIVAIAVAVVASRTARRAGRPPLHVLDLATLLTVIVYAVYATIARVWEWDFWAIWGLKARVFFEAHGIDWRFLEGRWNDFAHPDYPLLLPLNYVYAALIGGGWNDRWLGLFSVVFGIALLLIVRGLAAMETKPLIASAIAFAATAFALSRYVGLAEAPLIAFAGASILFLRRAVLFDDDAAMRHGAILAGLAASTKNEGIALLLTIAIVLALTKRKLVIRMWPAALMVLPWLAMRWLHALPTDLARGPFLSRVAGGLRQLLPATRLLVQYLNMRWMWVAILLALLIVPQRQRVRERFVLLIVAIQMTIYVAIILGSPRGVEWQIVTSWGRLSAQLAAPLLFVVMLMLARTFAPEDDLAHAEARPDH